LSDDYKAKNEVGEWLHLFNGLPFLSPDDATDAFKYDIMSTAPQNTKVRRFADYFCETYIDNTMFPPELWAQTSITVHSTTNGAEAFNRHFAGQFNSSHPTFYVFWQMIVKQQSVTYAIMNSLNTIRAITSAEKNRRLYVTRQWQKYTNASISRYNFIKLMGYRFPSFIV
jgi:hypothetical protein